MIEQPNNRVGCFFADLSHRQLRGKDGAEGLKFLLLQPPVVSDLRFSGVCLQLRASGCGNVVFQIGNVVFKMAYRHYQIRFRFRFDFFLRYSLHR